MSAGEKEQVKAVTRELLEKLKRELLVLDWRKRQQSRAEVREAIGSILDAGLPAAYTQELFEEKAAALYQHVNDHYFGPAQSVYEAA